MSAGVVQVTGELIASRRAGAYHHLTFVAPGLAEHAKPGQFVALAVGGDVQRHPAAPLLLDPQGEPVRHLRRHGRRRHLARRSRARSGSRDLRAHDEVSIVGPLGRAFPLPQEPVPCVLVGGGYGSAPLFWLAEALRERGCHVEMVLGAATEQKLFGVVEARRARRRGHRDDRRRVGRHQGLGLATCCPR